MHSVSHENAVNLLTGNTLDVRTNTPAFKQMKVRMQVLEVQGATPLPLTNPRYKKRHPQNGVEVYRKWNRPDYAPLIDQP
jgi:formate dehydrogenase major subunit